MASKYEELECLYAAVGKVIYEGLTNYEKATTNTNPTQLFGKTSSHVYFFFLLSCPRLLFCWYIYLEGKKKSISYSHYSTKRPLGYFYQLSH